MEYYGDMPYSEELYHYGVKGMKWGVRKAIEFGDKESVNEHYERANRKLHDLYDKANLLNKSEEKRSAKQLIGLGAAGTGLGAGLAALNVHAAKKGGLFMPMAIPFGVGSAALSATAAGLGVGQMISAKKNSTAKGHKKAVKNVREWQEAMKETFKGTPYAKQVKRIPKYEDVYRVADYQYDPKKHVVKQKVVAKISGDHLAKGYKGKDKDTFIKAARKAEHNASRGMFSPDNTQTNPNYYFKDLYRKEKKRAKAVAKAQQNKYVVHSMVSKA